MRRHKKALWLYVNLLRHYLLSFRASQDSLKGIFHCPLPVSRLLSFSLSHITQTVKCPVCPFPAF